MKIYLKEVSCKKTFFFIPAVSDPDLWSSVRIQFYYEQWTLESLPLQSVVIEHL